MNWLLGLLSPGALLALAQSAVDLWAKKTDTDLAKFKAASDASGALAVQVLHANLQYSAQRIAYATSLLSWWPFRIVLLILMLPPAVHFAAIMLDSTFALRWGIPKVPPPYDGYEREFILFFIVAKPVDTLIGGIGAALTAWLAGRK
jgi:hypothetical protein